MVLLILEVYIYFVVWCTTVVCDFFNLKKNEGGGSEKIKKCDFFNLKKNEGGGSEKIKNNSFGFLKCDFNFEEKLEEEV
jgi:hypothetical protein